MISKNTLRSLVSRALGSSVRRTDRRRQRALQAEQLESRIVLSAILLDVPGINGDTTVGAATSTDMELRSFEWEFSRTEAGTRASLSDPIGFSDLTFQRATDSASNDLYTQAALQTLDARPATLRLVDNGVNLLKLDLSNSRFTRFSTSDGQAESGALSFSNVVFTESVPTTPATTPRTASWNLLNGAVSNSAIVGQSGIDPSANRLNIETVMQIGNQKMLIDGFSWKADLNVDMSLANPLSDLAKGSNFKITRGVDSATAGLLGSAAGGTTIPEITISDRSLIAGSNRVTMEWKLYDAFFAGFGLKATENGAPKNSLELSYGRIELIVNQYSSTGVLTNTETTTWNEAGNVVTATNDFGIANPLLVDNTGNGRISSLNFGLPVGSPAGTPDLGRLAYESIDWSVSNSRNLSGSLNAPTDFGAMTVKLPTFESAAAPALLGQLARRSQLTVVNAFEKNTVVPTSALDTFGLTNVIVTGFSVKNAGLEETEIKFDLDFRSFTESFTDRTTPATPLTTAANFNVQTQTSTGALNFGGKTIDTNFELVITEAGVTSEIPVQSAQWGVSRGASASGSAEVGTSRPEQTSFDIEVPRGVHSPGLLAAAVRGTQIDAVSVRRYEVVEVNGDTIKRELYRWDLTDLFITEIGMDMRPGNSIEEVDSISFLPSRVELATPNADVGDVTAGWNFNTNTGSSNNAGLNELPATDPALRFKQNEVDQGIAIDSYQWGATLPVGNATGAGTRPLGNPNPSSLLLKATRQPSPQLLASALDGGARPQAIALPDPPDNPTPPSHSYELKVTGLLNGYSYSDAITATNPEIGLSVFVGGNANTAELNVTPFNGTPRQVTWNLQNDTTTNFSGFGNFQFATNQLPATTLEIAGSSQLAVDSYTFGIDNALNQLVGRSTAVVPLATRGNPSAKTFNVTTSMDRATPGLLNAIATRTVIPEIKITERRTAPNGNFLPWREWTLTNVYVAALANSATDSDPQGLVTLQLNAASATATFITYNAASTPTSSNRRLNFADPPAISPIGITAVSTDDDRVISFTSRFTDPQRQYSVAVVSGASLFDGVSLNAKDQLVLNYKPGQSGAGQIRVNGTNAFGLTSSQLFNVNIDSDGISRTPEGTDKTVTINEDVTYIISTSDFGFTDPNDVPANALTGVRITTLPLPATGSLFLNNVPVTLNQTIPVASLNANQLQYRPAAHGQGTNFASFTFQVQDNGAASNLDLTPNRMTFNVTAVNDAPTLDSGDDLAAAPVAEDTTNPAGTLVTDLLSSMNDVDAGAVKGMAVYVAQNVGGAWQFTLNNGTSWTPFGSATVSAARLLPSNANTRVRFVPDANFSGSTLLAFYGWDQTSGTAGQTANVGARGLSTAFSINRQRVIQTVTPVNDAPTIAAPDGAAIVFGTPLVFSTANSTAITIADVDAGTREMEVAITVTNGRFTLSTLTGITTTAGSNGSSALTVRGTLAALNAALAGSSFGANNTGLALVRIVANDLGNIGAGGARTFTKTIELPVALPSGTVDLGALNATTPTIRRSGNRNGSTATPDFYTFTIAAASDVRLNLSGLSADVDLRVFNAGGQMVGQSIFFSTTIENILMTALPVGTYLVDVRGQVVSSYDLTVSTATTTDDLITQAIALSSPTAVTLPTVRRQTVSSASDLQDYYRFNLTAASALRLNLSGLSQDVDFELLDSAGRVIQTAGVSGNTIENMLTSSLAVGTYHVRVFAASGLLTTNYELQISTATTSDDLLTNATFLGILGSQGSHRRTGNVAVGTDIQDYYSFVANGDVAISVSGLSSDADVQVLDRFGRVLASSTNSGNTFESINVNIASGSGNIFVRIFAFLGATNYVFEARNNSNAANADDLLSTATALPNPLTSLTRTGSVGGTGGSGDPQDYYRFQLTSVRNIALTLTGLSADLDLEVLDEFGRVLFFSRNSGNSSEAINIGDLGIGTYFIRVLAFSTSVSNYTLGVTV